MITSKFPNPYSSLVFYFLIHLIFCFNVGTQSGKPQPAMGGVLSYMQHKMFGKEEEYEFPDTLEGFGYHFNSDGELRTIDGNERFEFNVDKDNHNYNQKRYNALGDVITEYIYKIMEKELKLQKTYVPRDATSDEPKSFIFHSGDLYTADKVMILIHGSGAVRAGQWARRLIINENLESGTQIPYIKWAREKGFSVVVANTNINFVEPDSKKKHHTQQKIRGNGSPEEHTDTIWKDFIQRCPAKHIAIVAHSYGGVCVLELVKKYLREFEERVFAVALTDSVHGMRQQEADQDVVALYKKIAVNWASAYDELDVPLITSKDDVPTVSAGTDRHESTSYTSMNSIFKYIDTRFAEKLDPTLERFVVPKRQPLPDDQPVDRKKYWAKREEEKKAKEAAKQQAEQELAQTAQLIQIDTEEEEDKAKTEQDKGHLKPDQVEAEKGSEQAKPEQSDNENSNKVVNKEKENNVNPETRGTAEGAQKNDEDDDDDALIDLSSMKEEL